jgi:stage V sporulation protein AD
LSLKHIGKQTVVFSTPPSIAGHACVAGKKEGEGPLGNIFDQVNPDSYWGEKTWEKAESTMIKTALTLALDKAHLTASDMQCVVAGDLLNQCISSSFGLRDMSIPFFGVYGACSTMCESLTIASMIIDGGFADCVAAATSSHFCSAERQFRYPLEYGGQRTPTAQWTVTASGALVLSSAGGGPYVTSATFGKICDWGIKDANNMGAAMAPAAYDTISTHLNDLSLKPSDYDLIVTGDLGYVGSEILKELFMSDGIDISKQYNDCGLLMFQRQGQDVHAGASGCGCAASVLCGYLLNGIEQGRWKKILLAATGAMLSTTSSQQGQSIPGISYAVSISSSCS